MDSFKLLKPFMIFKMIIFGCIAAGLSYLLNKWLIENNWISLNEYTRFIAPIIEETSKAGFVLYFISKKKIGFMVDAAICGFAVGAGFSLIENIYYLEVLQNSNIFLWIIRGFGTAVMHGSSTAIFAIISKFLIDRFEHHKMYFFLPGLAAAILIHSLFNQFFFTPIIQTAAQLIVLPIIVYFVFQKSEAALRDWMETGLDTDVELLELINEGKISETHIGRYLESLRHKFNGTVLVDMLCYLRIYLELAARAKGLLMMKEAGIGLIIEEDVKEKLRELEYLEKNIGTTAKLTLTPIIPSMARDGWQLNLFKS